MMHPIKFPNRGSLLLALRHAIPHALPVALASLGTSRAAATPSARAKYAGGGRCFPILGVLGQPLKSMTCQ